MESPPMMITTGVGEGKRERGGGQVSPAEEEPRTLVTSSMATDRLAVVSDAQRRWHVGWGRVDESASLSPPSLAPSLGCIFYIYFLCVCVSCLFSFSSLSFRPPFCIGGKHEAATASAGGGSGGGVVVIVIVVVVHPFRKSMVSAERRTDKQILRPCFAGNL